MAARKIAALVHYGLMDRSAGRYRLSALGQRLLAFPLGSPEMLSARRSALERPVLFRSILDRFRLEGHISSSLAEVLATDFGITVKASFDAADIFLRSARFAKILANDGRLLGGDLLQGQEGAEGANLFHPDVEQKRFEVLLPDRKSAWLEIPTNMNRKDVTALAQSLETLLGQLSLYLGLRDGAEVRPFPKPPTKLRLTNSDETPQK
jgi:hypothetical protein